MTRALTEKQVLQRLHDRCSRYGGQVALADEIGCSASFVNAVLQGKKPPSPTILAAVGVERVVVYREMREAP